MSSTLTSEQQMLQSGVERFVREHGRFEHWRASTQAGLPFDPANWQRMAGMGWLGLGIPEAFGGIGGSPADTALVMDGFGRGLLREPYVSSAVLAARLLLDAGEHPRRGALLEGIADGSVQVATALYEAQGRFHLHQVRTTARAQGPALVLDGDKPWVPDAASARVFIVAARSAGASDDRRGISLYLVDADAPGLRREDHRSPDHQHIGRLRLEQVRVDASARIGAEGEALPLIERAVDHAIVARLAEACGAMDAVCAMTLEYLKTRKQFGTTIGSFQALQHRMVDMTIACEESRALLGNAVQALGAADANRVRAVAAAKARIGQCGLFVGHQAVQLHGGIGTSDELAVSHYLKRLLMIDLAYGNSDHHLERFAACAATPEANDTQTA